MNLCSLSGLLCIFGSTAVGALAGEGRGLSPAVWGAIIGFVIGFGSAFGVHSLERMLTRISDGKLVLVMLVALVAPFASGAVTVYVSQRVAEAFYDHTAIGPRANEAVQRTSATPTSLT